LLANPPAKRHKRPSLLVPSPTDEALYAPSEVSLPNPSFVPDSTGTSTQGAEVVESEQRPSSTNGSLQQSQSTNGHTSTLTPAPQYSMTGSGSVWTNAAGELDDMEPQRLLTVSSDGQSLSGDADTIQRASVTLASNGYVIQEAFPTSSPSGTGLSEERAFSPQTNGWNLL